ncbi:MAG: hypothetical protein UZ17_ACD001000977 [Acidobacteria bacterium OLB17]|nr:MAG: hypothetical protein UZ17_ACD001000977 [Acidobacteria bacterium OLB17]MCZ2391053.1 hypothetical protein [Acidobacteriota bacterium]
MKAAAASALILLTAFLAMGQGYSDRIDGYKVHKRPIVIRSIDREESSGDVNFRLDGIAFAGVAITAIKFEIRASVSSKRTATIERVRFEELSANGIPVKAEDLTREFVLPAGELTAIPDPLVCEVSSFGAAKAAWNELTDPKKEWRIKGKAFIFGRFRRFGMTFRRAVPVEIDVLVKNPIPPVRAVIFRQARLK